MSDEPEPEPEPEPQPEPEAEARLPSLNPARSGRTASAIGGRILASAQRDLTPRQVDLKALADATRLLINRLVATDASREVIHAATAEVQAAADRFADERKRSLYGFAEMANAGGYEGPLFDHSPLIGIANALAPPLRMEHVEDMILASVTFGAAYEGPPGCVHGGYVAAAFDEVLGAAQSMSGAPGMTGTLSVRYESPTPLHTELRFEGRLVGVERRKIFTEGVLYAGDRLTARATGTFISMQGGAFIALLDERKARQPGQGEARPPAHDQG